MVRAQHGREQVYRRQLPGGGFVAIEVTAVHSRLRPPKYHGELVVERRADRERRAGHVAPAVAEVDAASVSSVLQELFPLAQSNTEIARRCLARSRDTYPAPSPSPAASLP
jgi:hypothetical protein